MSATKTIVNKEAVNLKVNVINSVEEEDQRVSAEDIRKFMFELEGAVQRLNTRWRPRLPTR